MTAQQSPITRRDNTSGAAPRPWPNRWTAAGAGRRADVGAVLFIIALAVVTQLPLLTGGTIIGQDTASFFFPMFSFLGNSLRSGDIPGWNPHSFSGAPFAADPQSGWMYLPAMVLFTLLPLAAAAKSYMLLHILLAGLSTYALARALGIRVAGALFAAAAYEYSGYMYIRNSCCPNWSGLLAWLPVLLLGAELAIKSRNPLARAVWWGTAGLALSQILAIFLGQGALYALLAFVGFTAYRTLIAPPDNLRGRRARVLALVMHTGAVLTFGFGLAAAGLLPRLEFNALSNLAGGYARQSALNKPGWAAQDWLTLATPGKSYAGAVTLALAALAPVIARARYAVPYWTVLALGALILAGDRPTPLHSLLYSVVPGFAELHLHSPERIVIIFYLAAALLAGATVSRLSAAGAGASLVALAPLLGALLLRARGAEIHPNTLRALAAASLLVAVAALLPGAKRLAPALLMLCMLADLHTANKAMITEHMTTSGFEWKPRVDLGSYYDPTGAVRFLQDQRPEPPPRYFGYAPKIGGQRVPYDLRWGEPETIALAVNNRSLMSGLHDIQGYNPIHLARYDEFMAAVNGSPQEYHELNVYESGLDSPLLNLLNVRYMIVPAGASSEWEEMRALKAARPTVYSDSQVEVILNEDALPRAWLVHSARQAQPGQALQPLLSGAVDTSRTAVLEAPPPRLAQPEEPTADRVEIAVFQPDRISVRTESAAPGLLVLSEVYYPAWRAYVDGAPARVYPTDHALRGVAVPEGRHTVELRYESRMLRLGIALSSGFYAALATLIALAAFALRQTDRKAWND